MCNNFLSLFHVICRIYSRHWLDIFLWLIAFQLKKNIIKTTHWNYTIFTGIRIHIIINFEDQMITIIKLFFLSTLICYNTDNFYNLNSKISSLKLSQPIYIKNFHNLNLLFKKNPTNSRIKNPRNLAGNEARRAQIFRNLI